MALSNWDTLAFDNDGNPSNGTITNKDGNTVSIYKNWLYVRSNQLANVSKEFVDDTFAHINAGDIRVAGFQIYAHRAKNQQAVFCYVTSGYGEEEIQMCGIGAYGYLSDIELLEKFYPNEIKDIPKKDLKNGLIREVGLPDGTYQFEISVYDFSESKLIRNYEIIADKRHTEESLWTGINEKTFKEFKQWLRAITKSLGNTAYFDKLKKAKRFNQGDAYLSEVFGMSDKEVMTDIGEQKPTIFSQII